MVRPIVWAVPMPRAILLLADRFPSNLADRRVRGIGFVCRVVGERRWREHSIEARKR
jgi:hypothetical protein